MKKETYLRKLASTEITDDNTVGEAKVAKKVESELKRFWRKAALEYVRANEAEAHVKVDAPWIAVELEFNLKPAGSVIVNLLDMDARGYLKPVAKRYTIPKRLLLV